MLSLSFPVYVATLSLAILYITKNRASLHLPSRLHSFKCCNTSPILGYALLSVSDGPGSPALGHFLLIDFVFIAEVPEKASGGLIRYSRLVLL